MKNNLLYWIPTALVVLVMGAGGLVDAIRADAAVAVIVHLGYPVYFATLVGVAKVLGAIAIVAPVPRTVREWAYAGLAFDVTAAAVSHATVGDPVFNPLFALLVLALVLVSYSGWRRRTTEGRPAVAPALTTARA